MPTLASFLSAGHAVAAPISQETAKLVAKNWLYEQTGRYPSEAIFAEQADMSIMVTETAEADNPPYRIISFDSGGWVIVSGDDVAYPVIGYNSKGKAPVESLPPNLQGWLDIVAKNINAGAAHGKTISLMNAVKSKSETKIDEEKNKTAWRRLTSTLETRQSVVTETSLDSNYAELSDQPPTAVTPLLGDIQWGQGGYYNDECPLDSGGRTLTGCIATAMGQIMKKWNYPQRGVNNQTYKWADMPPQLSAPNYEVARLLRDIGDTVQMTYRSNGNPGSTASMGDIPNALINHFHFSPSAHYVSSESYPPNVWKDILMRNLSAGQPVIYSGSGSIPHAFVCDGYKTNSDQTITFHFNFGADGRGDGNYYLLDKITPTVWSSDPENFNKKQDAIFEIKPKEFINVAADLVIKTFNTTAIKIEPNGSLSVNIDTNNVQYAEAPSTNLNVYFSLDSTINTSDTLLKSVTLPAIPAYGSHFESLTITTPDQPGTFYLGACIETFPEEMSSVNNCSIGTQITISSRPVPDISMVNFTVSDYTLAPGQALHMVAEAKNIGNIDLSNVKITYYLSDNNAISPADTPLFSRTIESLSVAQEISTDGYTTPAANSSPLYYGACAEILSDEANTVNNCSYATPVIITTGRPTYIPDLKVDYIAASNSEPQPEQSISISAVIKNQGDADSRGTTLKYYLSEKDSWIATSDTYLGEEYISALSPGESITKTLTTLAPDGTGTYWVGAIIDPVADEVEFGNNYSVGFKLNVGTVAGGGGNNADLIVTEPHVNCNALGRGQTTRLSATIKNQGTGTSSSSTVRYYLSNDASISITDTLMATESLDGLSAEAAASVEMDIRAPSTTGEYWLGACVDPAGESVTTNNCSAAVRIRVQDTPDWWSDYAVTGIQIQDITPTLNYNWVNINATVTIKNFGNTSGGYLYPRIYWSTDRWIEPGIDTELESDRLNYLDGGEERTYTFTNTSSNRAGSLSSGTSYWVGVCVDAANLEIITSNNCSPGVQVWTGNNAAWYPDLLPSSPELSQTIIPQGSNFDANLTVENIGSGAAESGNVKIVRSNDSTINLNDTALATWSIGQLGNIPFTASTQIATSSWSAGTYYIVSTDFLINALERRLFLV